MYQAICQNEATCVNSQVLKRGQFFRGLSISPLARYNCLSNLRPRGDFARSISRGSSALPTVPETIDRCTIEEYEVKTTVCWKRPEDFGNNGKLIDVRMGGKQRKFHKITAAILNRKYIHKDFSWDSVPCMKSGRGAWVWGPTFLQRKNEKAAKII